jgi:hypothetical protein
LFYSWWAKVCLLLFFLVVHCSPLEWLDSWLWVGPCLVFKWFLWLMVMSVVCWVSLFEQCVHWWALVLKRFFRVLVRVPLGSGPRSLFQKSNLKSVPIPFWCSPVTSPWLSMFSFWLLSCYLHFISGLHDLWSILLTNSLWYIALCLADWFLYVTYSI